MPDPVQATKTTQVEIVSRAQVEDESKLTAPVLEAAGRMVVETEEHKTGAIALLQRIAQARQRVDAIFDPAIRSAHRAHKDMIEAKRTVDGPLYEADQKLRRMVANYEVVDQQRRERELQRKATEERRRLEQEKIRQAEALRKQREEEEAEALRQAEELAAQGRQEEADKVLSDGAEKAVELHKQEQAVEAAPVVVTAPTQVEPKKTAGAAIKTTWKAEVFDIVLLCKHIVDNPGARNLVEPNMTALNGMARSLKEGFSMPGVRAVSDKQVALTPKKS